MSQNGDFVTYMNLFTSNDRLMTIVLEAVFFFLAIRVCIALDVALEVHLRVGVRDRDHLREVDQRDVPAHTAAATGCGIGASG